MAYDKANFDRINFPMILLDLIQAINDDVGKCFLREVKDGCRIGPIQESKVLSLWTHVCVFEDEMYPYLNENYFLVTKPIIEEIETNLGLYPDYRVFKLIRRVFRLLIAEASANGFLIRQTEDDEIIVEEPKNEK